MAIRYLLNRKTLRGSFQPIIDVWCRLLLRHHAFKLEHKDYTYFKHAYNHTWRNERSVEIPIILEYIEDIISSGGEVLEVGNVLSHYANFKHIVVDKYEKSAGVHNVDILDYKPAMLFDCIVSISTLEHIGWEEEVKDPGKILKVLKHLDDLLKPGGILIVTIPTGYNTHLDTSLRNGDITFGKILCLKRLGYLNWIETDKVEVLKQKYKSFPSATASGLIIGVNKKNEH